MPVASALAARLPHAVRSTIALPTFADPPHSQIRPRPRVRLAGAAGCVTLAVLGVTLTGEVPAVRVLPAAAGEAIQQLTVPAPVVSAVVPEAVTALADATPLAPQPAEFTTALPDGRAKVAIQAAMAQIGLPYVWGGDGPMNGEAGFDCSGLTTYAYGVAGVDLPRTAHTQYYAGPHVPAGAPLQPGDLVFYGTPAKVHHVGMYLGDGRMVNAPTFGKPVRVAYYRWNGDDYLGATRPAATGQPSVGLLPSAPVPAEAPAQRSAPSTPEVFEAPPAPVPAEVPDPTVPQPAEAVTAAAALAEQPAATLSTTPAPAAPVVTDPGAGKRIVDAAPAATPAGTTTTPPPVVSVAQGAQPQGAQQQGAQPQGAQPQGAQQQVVQQQVVRQQRIVVPQQTTTPPPASTSKPSAPKRVVTAPSPSAATTTTKSAAADKWAVVLPGGTVELPSVQGAATAGGPAGVLVDQGRTVVRLSTSGAVAGAAVGARIAVIEPDGSRARYRVRSVETVPADGLAVAMRAASAGAVVVVAPDGAGGWTVLVAG